MIKKTSIRVKILGILIFASLLTLFLGSIGYFSLLMNDKTVASAFRAQEFYRMVTEMEMAHLKWMNNLGKFLRDENAKVVAVEKDPHNCSFGKWYYSNERRKVESEIAGLKKPLSEIESAHARYHESAQYIEDLLQKNKRSEGVRFFLHEVPERLSVAMSFIGEMKKVAELFAREKNLKMDELIALCEKVMLIAAIVGIILILSFGTMLSESIVLKMTQIMESLKSGSAEVELMSRELSNSSNLLSQSTSEQAGAIEETSSSLEEMSGMIDSNLKSSNESSILAREVSEITQAGDFTMSELVSSMKEIERSNKNIENVVKVIGEIAEKTKIIDEIVFQTKLLSFNASVEAERAGEHGRGFAVVATEVGNLAQMSGKAAKEISTIVKESIKEAERVATLNKEKVERGGRLVSESVTLLKKIGAKIELVLASAQVVTSASHEQSAGVKQISNAMEQLSKAVTESSITAEESAGFSQELTAQTELLHRVVNEMNQFVYGKTILGVDGKDKEVDADATILKGVAQKNVVPLPV